MSAAPEYISLFQFFKIFPNESAAVNFFETSRWPEGVRCPRCDKKESVSIVTSGKPQPYHCKECRKYFSVKVGTVMEASHVPLRTWLAAIYLMTVSRKGVSSCQLARQLDIQQKTSYFLLSRIREAWNTNGNFMLCGTIECDEAYFGGKEKNKHQSKKANAGRGVVGKTAVIAMKERDRNKVKAFPVVSTDSVTLQNSIKENVAHGSTLYTDEHKSYTGISGYKHETVQHSVGEYVKGMASTNGVESFWALLKRGYIGTFHHISEKHLHRYVNEFCTRHNMLGTPPMEGFSTTIRMMVDKRLTFKQLKA
jgi:transposase-like protein